MTKQHLIWLITISGMILLALVFIYSNLLPRVIAAQSAHLEDTNGLDGVRSFGLPRVPGYASPDFAAQSAAIRG
jgi:hypothetical protein